MYETRGVLIRFPHYFEANDPSTTAFQRSRVGSQGHILRTYRIGCLDSACPTTSGSVASRKLSFEGLLVNLVLFSVLLEVMI